MVGSDPPEVTLPNRRIGQMLEKETILDCIILANPQAVTEWRRDGRALHKGPKYDIDVFRDEFENSVTLSLRIKNLERADYGTYLCVGSNHLGEDQEEMTLYEILPTTTPTTTTISSSTSNFRYRVETEKSQGPWLEQGGQTNAHGAGGTGGQAEGGAVAASRGGEKKDWNGWEQDSDGKAGHDQKGDSYKGKDNTWLVAGHDKGPINSSARTFIPGTLCYITLVATVLVNFV